MKQTLRQSVSDATDRHASLHFQTSLYLLVIHPAGAMTALRIKDKLVWIPPTSYP